MFPGRAGLEIIQDLKVMAEYVDRRGYATRRATPIGVGWLTLCAALGYSSKAGSAPGGSPLEGGWIGRVVGSPPESSSGHLCARVLDGEPEWGVLVI
jgi:hypothetical protein